MSPPRKGYDTLRTRLVTDWELFSPGWEQFPPTYTAGVRGATVQTENPQARPVRARFHARAQALKEERGAEIAGLAREMSSAWRAVDRATVRNAIQGHRGGKSVPLPTLETAESLDRALSADGELLALWQAAVMEDTARRIRLPVATGGLPPATGVTVEPRRPGEVGPTDRRDVLRLGAAAPAVAAAFALAESASHAFAAQPSEWTVAQLEEGTTAIAESYWSTPHDQLLATLVDCYQQAESIGRGTRLPAAQARLSGIAGQYAYYLARLGYHSGDRRLATAFGVVAEQYAAAADDPLLSGAVAGLRSCTAFIAGRYTEAARVAEAALRAPDVHAYTAPRLAAYLASAEAAAGRQTRARAALDRLGDVPLPVTRLPGPGLFDPAERTLYRALTLAELEDPTAVEQAQRAIEIYPPDHVEGSALAWCALARGHVRDDPGRAADAAVHALTLSATWPAATVVIRARHVHSHLTAEHAHVPEVASLGRTLDTTAVSV